MRKIVLAGGFLALVAVPIMADAAVTPAAIDTMLLQDTPPASIPVKKHTNFLPLGLEGAIVGSGIGLAVTGASSNSPS